jgi:hypothetical protein
VAVVGSEFVEAYLDFSPECPMYGTMTVLCLGTCFNSLEAFHTLLWNI